MLNFAEAKNKFAETISHLESDLRKIRTGRPTPDMFTGIQVEAYGSKMGLEGVANINVVDASLVTIQPWDKSTVQAIVNALSSEDYGYNPVVDADLIRVPIASMTQEKRQEVVKQMKEKGEHYRIQIRQIRKDAMDFIAAQKSAGDISEDQAKGQEKQIQEEVDATNIKIDSILSEKERSLMQL
jgi:ribosome recycling factor